ncbi:PepSY domain-containing protein [Limisphaera sp. VF-2]|uniref:PepSY domain-containing protein n=1 Tax=Limisphaera sp. VF-2 TaxID=3400418 RepID=UPI001758298F
MSSLPQPKHAGLIRMRQWHRWGGVAAALFLLVFSITGMILNYKEPVLNALGLAPRKDKEAATDTPAIAVQPPRDGNDSSFVLTTATRWSDLPTLPEVVLERAQEMWGRVPLERMELRMEHGRWVWKLKRPGGEELIVDASTGEAMVRGRYERLGPPDATGQRARSVDWGKILLDLHTGKIAGAWGKAIMTLAGGGLLFLTISGLYVWCKPLLIRRGHARARRDAQLHRTSHRAKETEVKVPAQVP